MYTEREPDRRIIAGIVRSAPRIAHLFVGALSFLCATSAWSLTRVETVPDGIGSNADVAGTTVALFGDTAAVGAPNARIVQGVPSGSVAIFRHVGSLWQREAFIAPDDPTSGQSFGTSIALGQDLLVAGTNYSTDAGGAFVYTFARTGTTWQQVDKFAASTTVSLSGDTLAVGGGAIYTRSGNGWTLQTQLIADEGEVLGATTVDGDTAIAESTANLGGFQIHLYASFYRRTGVSWAREYKLDLGSSGIFDGGAFRSAVSDQTALIETAGTVTAYVRDPSAGTWTSQGQLDPLASVGLTGPLAIDGDVALVGSPSDDVLGHAGAGTVYEFKRQAGSWTRAAHLYLPGIDYDNAQFGSSVALTGDQFLAGSPGAHAQAGVTGDATVFALQADVWTPTATLDLGNARRDEQFGAAVALSGTTLLAGAPSANNAGGYFGGAAYVFESSQGGWVEQARLGPSSGVTSQGFGSAVALEGDTAVVGANYDDVAGAVYVFSRADGSWPQQARLTGGGSADGSVYLGWSVALSGDVVAAGEPARITDQGGSLSPAGRVRLFQRTGTTWSPQAIVQAADGNVGNEFGYATALAGDTLVIGAPRADVDIETDAGAVYVYTGVGGVWTQQARITAPVAAKRNGFGRSVAVVGDMIVVGAGDEDPATSLRGAAYVYVRSGGVWSLQATLRPPAGELVSGSFGHSVALSATTDRIVVGQPYGTNDDQNGRAFVFARSGSTWAYLSTLQSSMPAAPGYGGEGFGTSTGFSGGEVVIGSPRDGRSGAAYLAGVGDVILADGFDGN